MDGVGWRWCYLGSPPDDYHVTMEVQLESEEEAGSFIESERLLELDHKKAAGTELSRFPTSGLLMRSSGNMSLISVADFFVVVLLVAWQVYRDRKNMPVLTKTCDK